MDKALDIGMSGAKQNMLAQRAHANNLANVNTTGFKRDRAVFQDLLYQVKRQPGGLNTQNTELPSGLQLGTGVRVVGTAKQFTQGNLQITEQPLDMAVNGRDGTVTAVTDDQAGLGSLEQGSIESSNVEVVEELVNMITTQRAYEMNSKVVSTVDQMLQFITNNIG